MLNTKLWCRDQKWNRSFAVFVVIINATTLPATINCDTHTHTLRERRHFHFTYGFKVSALYFISLVAKWNKLFYFLDENAFSYNSQSVWCTMHAHIHIHTNKYIHSSTIRIGMNWKLTKCAQCHWRNVEKKYFLISVVIASCTYLMYTVSKRVFSFKFFNSSYLSLWFRCSKIYTIMSKILWPFY